MVSLDVDFVIGLLFVHDCLLHDYPLSLALLFNLFVFVGHVCIPLFLNH